MKFTDKCIVSLAAGRLVDLVADDGRGFTSRQSLAQIKQRFPDAVEMESTVALALLDDRFLTEAVTCKESTFKAAKENSRNILRGADFEAVVGEHVYGAIKVIYLALGRRLLSYQGRIKDIGAKVALLRSQEANHA